MTVKHLHIAHTQGFCAGVVNAIDIVNLCIKKYGTPLYVRHAIVHNTSVIKDFENKGVIFVEDLSDVPDNQVIVFSAHGTAPDVFDEAKKRGLTVVDATCPLVTKIHRQAQRHSTRNTHVIFIGHRGHQELIGTSGYVASDYLTIVEDYDDIDALSLPDNVDIAILTQTTLSVDDTSSLIAKIKQKYPKVITGKKEDICYATQNRQNAVKELAEFCEFIIVCGSPNSSNSNRLVEAAIDHGAQSCIIDLPDQLDIDILNRFETIGLTSGASVPQYLIDDIVKIVQTHSPAVKVHTKESVEKGISFPLPAILKE